MLELTLNKEDSNIVISTTFCNLNAMLLSTVAVLGEFLNTGSHCIVRDDFELAMLLLLALNLFLQPPKCHHILYM